MAAGLLGRKSGRQLPLRLLSGALPPSEAATAASGSQGAAPVTLVLLLTGAKQSWVFGG